MGNHQALLDRTAVLMSKDDGERARTLKALCATLEDFEDKQGQDQVLGNKAVMDVLLSLGATTRSADVVENALQVLAWLSCGADNSRRLFREHPSLVLMAMRKLELGAQNATQMVQLIALDLLGSLTVSRENVRGMVTENPALVRLLVAKAESDSEQMQVEALDVLKGLAANSNNAQEMVIQHATLIPLLVAKVESDSDQVQAKALCVLQNLAVNADKKREMTTMLVSLLLVKVESNSEQVQISALNVLQNLACNDDIAREMVTQHGTLIPLLLAKMESDSEQVQVEALDALQNLAVNVDNAAEMMAAYSAVILRLLMEKMSGNTVLQATRVIYLLSCFPANRAILREYNLVVATLTKGREDENEGTSFFSLLALVNLFGAEEDSEVLKTNLGMLQQIFDMVAHLMDNGGWDLNNPFLAFRYLCVVEHNRQLLWGKYGSEFLSSVFAALQQAIVNKETPAVENVMSTLAQFSSDAEPLAWMRSNKPQLDRVFAQLARFPDAQRTAQFLQLTLDPPKVAAAPVQVSGSKPTIMISYNWNHQAHARLIHSLLESQGYPVWRDEQNMKADIMTAMADAVSKSTVVLVLVSPLYKESANCQMECQFAHNNNRKLIPVLVEPGYVFKADGWLGLLLGSKLYYDVSRFHNAAQMESVVLSLLRGEVEGGQVAATAAAPPVAATPKRPVPQNEAEIREWLSNRKHGEEIADMLVKNDLIDVEDLERLSKMKPGELKSFLELTRKQVLVLEAALKEIF